MNILYGDYILQLKNDKNTHMKNSTSEIYLRCYFVVL